MQPEYLPGFEIKEVAEDGTFTGVASVYGVEDLGGDVIDKGAFTKTIAENAVVPILWQHKSDEVIGEGRLREWQGKVYIDGKLDLEDPMGQKAYGKMKRKLVKGLSIGFTAVKTKFEEVEQRMIRHIAELKLWEVSVVTFPMLPAAQVVRVKDQSEDLIRRLAHLESQVQALTKGTAGEVTTDDTTAAATGERAADESVEPAADYSTFTLNLPTSLLS